MKIIDQSYEILFPAPLPASEKNDGHPFNEGFIQEAKLIEIAGRTAYKSEDSISNDSYDGFIRGIVKHDHGAVLEFGNMMVRFITDRGVSHEIVRMRMCSFLQESTRYCNYAKDKFSNEITVVRPSTWKSWLGEDQARWEIAMLSTETQYLNLIKSGRSPQEARSVLPNSLKTEICVKTNFREWRHIFKLRAISKAAHPDMRDLMIPLYEECRKLLPSVFDMGDVE